MKRRIIALVLILAIVLTCGWIANAEEDSTVRARRIVEGMTIEERLGQTMLMSFANWARPTDAVKTLLNAYPIGSVILFGNNTPTTARTVEWTSAIQTIAAANDRLPCLIAIDQEGGNVVRLGQSTRFPGNMAIGATNDPQYAYQAGVVIGTELTSVGVHMDCAPDSDVNENPNNPVIGLRSFGADAGRVADFAVQMAQGLEDGGAIACAKHFPGHGNTATDSHTGLPRVDKTRAEWEAVELAPFKALIANGLRVLMTAHIQYPGLDSTTVYADRAKEEIVAPATLSAAILQGIVRDELGYDGVIVTDALNMGAIAERFTPAQAAIYALNAGVDLLCMPYVMNDADDYKGFEEFFQEMVAAVEGGRLAEARVSEAAMRVVRLKIERGLLDAQAPDADAILANAQDVIGCEAHRATERAIAEAAITVYPNGIAFQPLTLKKNAKLLAIMPYDNELASARFGVARTLRELGREDVKLETVSYEKLKKPTNAIIKKVEQADALILCTEVSAVAMRKTNEWRNAFPRALLSHINGRPLGANTVVASLCLPYDAKNYAGQRVLLAYGYIGMSDADAKAGVITGKYGPNIPAVIAAALGAFAPAGVLPVNA